MYYFKVFFVCCFTFLSLGIVNTAGAESIISFAPRSWIGFFDFEVDDVDQDGHFILGGATMTVRPKLRIPSQYSVTILYGKLDGDAKVKGGKTGDYKANRFDLEALYNWKTENKSPWWWAIGLRLVNVDAKSTLPNSSPKTFPDTKSFKDEENVWIAAVQFSGSGSMKLAENHKLVLTGSLLPGLNFYTEDVEFGDQESGVQGFIGLDGSLGYDYSFGDKPSDEIGGPRPYGFGFKYRVFGGAGGGDHSFIHGPELFFRKIF